METLIERGLALLDSGEAEEALIIGRTLEERGHPCGFEIQAEALLFQHDHEGALAVLERGVERAPEHGLLWYRLGQCLTDLGRLPQAVAAYLTALDCPEADPPAIRAGLSRAHLWRGEPDVALLYAELALRELPQDHEAYAGAMIRRIQALLALSRGEEALQEAQTLMSTAREGTQADLAIILGVYALALWEVRGDAVGARQAAQEAILLYRSEPSAIEVLQQLNPPSGPESRPYHLVVHGRADERRRDGEPLGFYTNLWVVADSPQEALEYTRVFVPPAYRDALEIDEIEALDDEPAERKGVWAASRVSYDYASDEE